MDVLLIVDMQVAGFAGTERHQAGQVVANINALADHFRRTGRGVIHIRHEEPEGDYAAGSPGAAFLPSLVVGAEEPVVSKRCCDGFVGTDLLARLQAMGARRLCITGCATDFCVDSTLKAALSLGFDLLIPADGHTTADRPHVSAEALIAHFNWNWAELISDRASIQVLPTAELLSRLA